MKYDVWCQTNGKMRPVSHINGNLLAQIPVLYTGETKFTHTLFIVRFVVKEQVENVLQLMS
jgi:hypothetical protein